MADDGSIPVLATTLLARTRPIAETITWSHLGGGDLSRTWRVTFGDDEENAAIVKWTAAREDDAAFAAREALAYSRVLGPLRARTPRLLGRAAGDRAICVVLEDLSTAYRFHNNEEPWTAAELHCLIPAYARMHAAGTEVEHQPWMLSYQSPEWTPETVASDVGELQRVGEWGSLPGLASTAGDTLQRLGSLEGHGSLLHLDCDPSNAGIARDGSCEVAFIDWDMTGWGAPEFDLAYLYLHPFDPTAALERSMLLDLYWSERERVGGDLPDGTERHARQSTADRALALALVRVARRSLDADYLPGKRAERYWSAMRPLLYRRLVEIIG